ncbi:MAG: NUDIX domain-containing protein, partial [Prevotella sp.]|nr:NUDIX domain-containing protein [Prevotella sp.]
MEHPLEKFKYCPVCGSSHFEVNNFKSKKCQDCGFTYYGNPCSATAAFIVNDKQEMLVVRRAKEPAKGTLDLPGGFVDMGETVEQGMRREIKEETGLDIEEIQYLFSSPNVYLYSGMGVHTLDMDFLVP